MTRFEDAWERHKKGRLTAEEAGELLGVSARHFRRLRTRYEAFGVDGLRDRRLGRVSGRRAPEGELDRMRRLYREEYADFTVKHFHEELGKRHNYTLGYTVTRLALQSAGLVRKATRRVSIARSGRGGRCRGCCCFRTVRRTAGSARSSTISTWW